MNENKINLKDHWNKVYSTTEISQLGWYEENPEASLKLIKKINLMKNDVIIDIGSGCSTIIDKLTDAGFEDIIAADISEHALDELKKRLGAEKSSNINFITEDISLQSAKLSKLKADLWHDRTLLHFLITEKQQKGYLTNLRNVVKLNGFVIIAVFSLEGAKKCSGLDVKNYDQNMIADFLGDEFKLLEHLNYTYIQPSGSERPFVYTLFQRTKNRK